MLSRLAQGVNSVLQELSGEESPEAGAEDGLTPRTPAEGDGTSAVPGDEEDAMERLAQMEQLVVQLKEMIREKDGQLISAEKQLKEEKEAGEMRLAKLKLQAKAKVAVLSKQVSELKGQDGAGSQSPDNSFTMAPVLEEELQQLRLHLQEEESVSRALREQLEASERGAHEAEEKYTEQLRAMQAVVCEKDIRFREQVQKHEEELLKVSAQVQSDGALQQALRVAQRRTEELEEALHSRSQVLDILQQELNSADQQKQILTTQFRQMEQELAETRRRQEEERQQWAQEASQTQAEMASLTQSLEAAHREREEGAGKENKAVAEMEAELGALKERLEAVRREKNEMGAEAELRGAELAELKSRLEAAETKTGEVEGRMKTEAEHRVAQLTDLRARLEAVEAEREGVVKRMEAEAEQRAEELTDLKTRLEAAEAEKVEVEKKMEAEAEQKGVELAELKSRLEASEAKRREVEERVEVEVEHREAELSDLRLRLEASEAEREGVMKRMEAEAEVRGAELPELRVRLEATKAESEEVRQGIDEALGMMEGEPAALRGTDREAQQTLLLTELWKGLCALADGEADGLGEEPLVPRDSAQCGAVLRALEARLLRLGTTELHQQASLTMDTLQGEPEGAESETHIQQSLQPIDTLQDVGQSSRAPVNQAHLEEEAVEASDLPEMGSDGEGGSALSRSVCTEGSPELISLQPESSEEREMKGTSSDEMVTSTDSEVAQSSWTLLEAGNQEGVLDWNSSLQDFDQLAHQPWEQTSEGPGLLTASSLHLQSSSVVIHESVHVTVTQQDDQTAGQAFAQALAQELQNKYSELMAELQLLREEASDSRVRVQRLQEEEQVLRVAKEAAEARVREFEEALQAARAELYEVAQQRSSHMESQNVENGMLQEQLCSLQTAACCKDQKIEALQADMDRAQHYIAEQESKFGILNAQLDEKNQAVSELEQKLKDSEAQLQDLEDLTLCLSQKEQEMMELNNAMSAKLLQAGEEKFLVSSEVANLKHQVLGLKSAMEEQVSRGSASEDELRSLQKEKQDLSSQVTAMKKEGELMKRKLQAALVQRKELMKKVEAFEKEAESIKEQGEASEERSFLDISGTDAKEEKEQERNRELLKLETALEEANQKLKAKEESLEMLEQKIAEKDKTLTEMFTENQRQIEEADNAKSQLCNDERLSGEETGQEKALLQSQLSALESEHDTLQKKLQEALESRKETIRKAKEKDRRHREQLKQQKEEYNGLLGRFEEQGMERDRLLIQLKELEEMKAQNMQVNLGKEPEPEPQKEATEKPVQQSGGDWCQEDWVDFAAPESGSDPQKSSPDTQPSLSGVSEAGDDTLKPLGEEVQAEQAARLELERQLQYSQKCLALRESELLELSKELELLREKEWQINTLTLEITDLREKCRQAETQAEMLRAEVEAATALETGGGRDGLESPITQLQAEVEEFRQFLSCKNNEILELSQQLSEQNSLLQVMQETVSEKDQVIISLQENLRAEKEKSQKLEAKEEGRKEEEKIDESRLQQLQRKLQAALISRKDVLKENKLQKDGITLLEKEKAELQTRLEAGEAELVKLRMEREKLIAEVDKTLLENQGLGASCESLKLAMEGVLTEKEEYKKEVTLAKEQVAQVAREWEERVQGMKEEYETLLKSYENVSDEAERVQRVLEAARQERQDLVVKMRAHEVARKEAERLAEEARKEVETTKDKMRKFAKAKQQKIMDLEEENEKLREKEERSAGVEYMKQKEELDRAKEELETLRADLDSTRSERDLLVQESAELRQKLAQEMEKGITHNAVGSSDTEASVEEAVTAQQSSIVWIEASQELKSQTQKHETGTLVLDSALVKSDMETSETTKDGMQMRIDADKELRRVQEDELKEQLASLEQQLEEKNMNEESLRDEIAKWEVKYQEVQARLEAEKDDLEEQLMNQMAQLNGSIAGYQQEAADGRERLVELQRSLEKLESERAEFEAQAKSERDRAARLEEDKRQAQRERAEAEAEAGRQRELEQKLKSAQRGKEGSQSRARQLEELLREKQLEVRQMQKDCIKYQEKISEQEKEAKALQMARDEAKHELSASCVEATKATEELKKVEAELSTCRIRLDDALSEVGRAEAEKRAAEERSARREAESRAEAERTLDAVRLRLGAELKQTERIAEDLQREREREEQAALEARQLAESRERQAQEMQSRLHESLARLAAFSRSMSSLQDDRDRVLDEARQWESRFHSVLQGKEAEVREAETRARDLGERLQKETARREELLLALERMQKSEADWQRRCEEQEGTHEESLSALENQREALQEALTQVEESLAQKSSSLTSLEAEAEGLRHRAQALEGAVGDLQQEVEEAQAELRERQAEERRLALSLEQLETDLRSSKKLTETLQAELEGKEKREVELLGEKELAVAQAADEARQEAEGRAQEAEKELERWREEARGLEEQARMADEESSRSKARLAAFTKAMGSLQDDRDRVLGQYKQLEERHLQVIVEKDSLIQEAAAESNSMKEQLRGLLVQTDDLNAEKAKLSAQLHRYRDDLTSVLSMKDSQQKQLLAAQMERIAALERERSEMQGKIQEEGGRVERETPSQAAGEDRREGAAVVEKLREQLEASQKQVVALEEALCAEREGNKDQSKELNELRWEGGVLRTQAETAEERVAELARDLVEMEQKLLEERDASSQLRAENQSFGQAMASLQDSRDQALNEAQELRLRLEETGRMAVQPLLPSPPAGASGEVWALKNALSALQNDRERLLEQLNLQGSEMSRLRQEAAEMARVMEEKRKAEEALQREERMGRERSEEEQKMLREIQEKEEQLEVLRLERQEWQAQAEVLKEQTMAALIERDEQVQHLSAVLEEARAVQPRVSEEQYQREASSRTDVSSEGQVLPADSGQLSSQLNDTLRELHSKEVKITELSSKLSQVYDEKRQLAAQLRGSTQRLGDSQSRCGALQRQLQELQEDKRKGMQEVDSAPGAPQERSEPSGGREYRAELKELQRRLDEEQEQRLAVEEQLSAMQDRLKRQTLSEWRPGHDGNFSETAVLIEPPEGAVTQTRSSSPGLSRILRVAFCSRQRTPLLATLYLLTVHVLLLLCLGGYL